VPDARQSTLNVVGGVIGVVLVLILGFMAWALVYRAIPDQNESTLNVLLGILSTQVGIVVGFYFGSSVSSKRQTETIDKLADTARAAMPATTPDVTLEPGQTATVAAESADGPTGRS
jgi:hypothetical protein